MPVAWVFTPQMLVPESPLTRRERRLRAAGKADRRGEGAVAQGTASPLLSPASWPEDVWEESVSMFHLPVKRFFPFSWHRECLWAQEGEQESGAGGGVSPLGCPHGACKPWSAVCGGQWQCPGKWRSVGWECAQGIWPCPSPSDVLSFRSSRELPPQKAGVGRWLGRVQSLRVPGLGAGCSLPSLPPARLPCFLSDFSSKLRGGPGGWSLELGPCCGAGVCFCPKDV